MAGSDYRLCDVCSRKAFYDVELGYDDDGEPFRIAGEQDPHGEITLDYLGDWAVLCLECAKTHRTAIVPITTIADTTDRAEEN